MAPTTSPSNQTYTKLPKLNKQLPTNSGPGMIWLLLGTTWITGARHLFFMNVLWAGDFHCAHDAQELNFIL